MTETTTWFNHMDDKQIDKLGEKIDGQEMDSVFFVTAGAILHGPPGVYAPEVYNDETEDITIDGRSVVDSGWTPLTGYTGQHGYRGAVMHTSEYIGGRLAEDIIEMSAEAEAEGHPLLWAITSVECFPDEEEPEDPTPAGWVVLYRET